MVEDCHWSSFQVLESSIVDGSLADLLVVAIHFIFVDHDEAFFVLVLIKEGVCVHFDAMEFVLAVCALFAVSLENRLRFSVVLHFVDDYEKRLRAIGSQVFNSKCCQFCTIICFLLLSGDLDLSVFLYLFAIELRKILSSGCGDDLA